MKTTSPPISDTSDELWVPISKLAKPLGCSMFALHDWGKKGKYGYRQLGPRNFVVCLPEVLVFYTAKYPNIVIDFEEIDLLLQHTA